MTICIAGISNNKQIVGITDKMLTLPKPVATTYEITENNKIIKLTDKSFALFAGDVIGANSILSLAKKNINEGQSVNEIAELVKKAYKDYWTSIVNDNLFQRYQLSLDSYMENQKNIDQNLVQQINHILGQHNVGVEIIIAGLDGETPFIYKILNPGTIISYNSVGYCCIGSGMQHATLSLIESEYHSGLSVQESVFATFQAKKKAEYDPGVGELCDVVLLNDNYKKLTTTQLSAIIRIYNDYHSDITQRKSTCFSSIENEIINN
jgi:20S proteasome alpha/beta subunit